MVALSEQSAEQPKASPEADAAIASTTDDLRISDFKLQRANGECLGTYYRRRTRSAAI